VRQRNPKFEWQDAFLSQSRYTTGSVIAVAWWLANRWNGGTDLVTAPVERIVNETAFSKSAVEKALRKLREDGWIAQHRRGRNQGRWASASTYRLTVPTRTSVRSNPYTCTAQPVQVYGLVDPLVDPSPVDPVGLKPVGESTFDCFAAVHDGTDGWCICLTPTPSRSESEMEQA